jgi:hypothetical protein
MTATLPRHSGGALKNANPESRDEVIQALNISGFRIDAQGAPSGMTVCVKLLRTD